MLTKIDDLSLPDHPYLTAQDECYFIGEYTAGRGFAHSTTNQLIYNLKKSVDRRGRAEYWHKEDAIRRAGATLAKFLNPAFIQQGTFIPVPPSRAKDDPLYDNRISQVIRHIGPNVDLRELVCQKESMAGAHTSQARPKPHQLYENYRIAEDLVQPRPVAIAVVDDILTTGAHFKAAERILKETYGDIKIVGLFLARRVPNTE